MLVGVNMEREPLLSASILTELELSDAPLLLGSTDKMAAMDMLLGAGGAAAGAFVDRSRGCAAALYAAAAWAAGVLSYR